MNKKLKLVVIDKKNHLHWGSHIHDACKVLGINSLHFHYNVKSTLLRTTREILNFTFGNDNGSNRINLIHANMLAKKIQYFEPDFIIFAGASFVPQPYYEALSDLKSKPKIIGWIGDRFQHEIINISGFFDKLYFTDTHFKVDAKEFGLKNYDYLPLAYNQNIFKPSTIECKKENIVFIGNPSEERDCLFNALSKKITIYGPHWNDRLSNSVHEVNKKRLSLKTTAEIYTKSIAVINMKQGRNVVNGLNMRSFEVPASGCTIIHDNIKDLSLNFDTDKEVIKYDSLNELENILDKISNNAIDYATIAKNGYKRVLAEHSYVHRLKKMLSDF